MVETAPVPRYMEQLLDQLGWNKGTRIPLANPENQELENVLIARQNEIQCLKEALTQQNEKRNDLKKYKLHVNSEYQENTRLLFALKSQLEQEVKLYTLAESEIVSLQRSAAKANKESKNLNGHIDNFQAKISQLLKRADELKKDVCGEKGALQEWRAAIERSASDIDAIEQFTKHDTSLAKDLETKRQKLKVEHDRLSDRLNQMIGNLAAEERACERISVQVIECIEQRNQIMMMWASAVENLRQRDVEIRHVREDYAALEAECTKIAEEVREQQNFYQQHKANNEEAIRENKELAAKLGQLRVAHLKMQEYNTTLASEVRSFERVLSNMQSQLEKLHIENKRIMAMQQRKDLALGRIYSKIQDLRQKLAHSTDKSKSAEKRAKELEEMLNEEERYASQLTANEQRSMHCSFVEQQKLLVLTNEEKLFKMQIKSSNAVLSKLDAKQVEMEKKLQTQKESLYIICYQVETIGARVAHMEGEQAERELNEELVHKEERLKDVVALHAARVALLERHSGKLMEDMRKYAKDLEFKGQELLLKKSRLKTALLNVEGGEKETNSERETLRQDRVEEALMRLRVAHATRAVAGFEGTAFSIEKQRLQLEAAMNERMVEIGARRDLFNVQKMALVAAVGKLRMEIKEREQRIDQLIKRYDIFISSLGKDDSGQQVSVAFFKIKFAAERAELRQRGATLDAEIGQHEKDVSALEATVRVVHAAHKHFMYQVMPLEEGSEQMQHIHELNKEYYDKRDELKVLSATLAELEEKVNEQSNHFTMLKDKTKQLATRETEAETELEAAKERVSRQETRLNTAKDIVKHNARRAKKLVEGVDDWRIFQLSLWIRDYAEAAHNAIHAMHDLCLRVGGEPLNHFAALLSASDLKRHMTTYQRRLQMFIDKIVADAQSAQPTALELDATLFSSSTSSKGSGVSLASAYMQRFVAFRRQLAEKVQEPGLTAEIGQLSKRSTVSLKVVTLGLEEGIALDTKRTLAKKGLY